MKKNILICFLSLVSLVCITAGCVNNEIKNKTVNCGEQVNLLDFFGEGDSILNAKFYDVDGKEMPLESGLVYLSNLGKYKLVLQSGTTYVFSCEDLEGPIAALKDQPTIVYNGDTVNTELVFYDRAGADVKSSSVTVTFEGNEVQLEDNKFVAENCGDYIVTVTATDAKGNEYVTKIKVESIETVYGKGIYVIPEQDDAGVIVNREKYTDGENAGKYRTVIRKDFYDTGFGYLTIKATKDAGLKPNTYYGLSITVNSEHDGWCYYNPDNEWLTKKSSPTVNFTIKTDENGEYYKRWWTYHSWSSYFDFSSVTFHEYSYGHGVNLSLVTPVNATSLVQKDEEILIGENAGKYIKTLTVNNGDFFTMKLSATPEANLNPNSTYMVNMTIDTDGAYPAVYEIHTSNGVEYNDWFIDKDNSLLSFNVTTDAKGAFSHSYRVYVRSVSSYVKFSKIEFFLFNGYAYGQGIDLSINSNNSDLTVKDVLLDENAGDNIYVKCLNRNSSNFASLSISANESAGLNANSEYVLTVTTLCDGEYPAYYQVNDEWHVGGNKTQFSVTVYTDDNGRFSVKWNTYFRTGTYVKFTAVDLELVNYAYPLGVYVEPTCSFGAVGVQELTEGDNIGKKIVVLTKESSKEGACKLTVRAVKQAGLKANTTYVIRVRIDTDKDSFWAYYDMNNAWLVKKSQPYAEFEVTTDANGEFEKLFDKVYFGTNCTYAKFSEIMITEK